MKTITVYAVSNKKCDDCGNAILAFNEVALKLLNDAAKKGTAARCGGCQELQNRRLDLTNGVFVAELPY